MFKENLTDIKILIVEDEKNISNAEKKYLEVEGFEVDQAFDGQEAIDMINTTDYSLIILDLMLPKVSGEKVMEIIRSRTETPVIMVTAKIDESEILDELNIAGWYYLGDHTILSGLIDKDRFNILLSHKPNWYFDYVKQYDFDLVLSGHAHGGQMRLFGIPIIAPDQGLFPKYVKGKFDKLIISTGLSNPVHIPRLFNPKEIVIINLKAEH